MTSDYTIDGIFPIPVYSTYRDSGLDSTEKKEIEDIIKEGYDPNLVQELSTDTYIFDTKLKKLKEFIEQHIKLYVKEVINPREELNIYITQSWVSVIRPSMDFFKHWHPNSVISGVFYISTMEIDQILFYSPLDDNELLKFGDPPICGYNVNDNQLIIFPSWLGHSVGKDEMATKDRISISFNTFLKGTVGQKHDLTRLVLE